MSRFGRTRNRAATALTAALAWGASTDALAGVLSEDIKQAMSGRGGGDILPVIITFVDRVDLAPFRAGDRRARSAALITALQERAAQTQGPVAALLQAHGARGLRQLWVNNSLAAEVPVSVIARLERITGIENVRLDAVVAAPVSDEEAAAAPEWNILAIGAPALWARGFTGAGTVVANMDSGVDASHPDLAGAWRGGSNSWYDPNGEHATPHDRLGHGTQTMGLMVGGTSGGSAVGVAPGAQWVAVKIFNDAGYATLSGIHSGFQWLLDPDGDPATADAPDVVNNSWGLHNSGGCNLEFNTDMEVAKAAGISVVFSGGNSGPAPLTSESPANNPAAVGVGAVDSALALAGFSSHGPSACDGTWFPELTAPGMEVRTTDLSFGGLPLYATVSGTSFAAPHVSGALALLTQAFPEAEVTELAAALMQSARDQGLTGPDNSYGYGLLDVAAAYEALAAQSPAPPVNTAPTAGDDLYSVQAGVTLSVAAPGLLGNDSDPDGDALTAQLVSPPSGGTVMLNADGSFSYTPGAGTTADAFSYRASDGDLVSDTAQVAITVVANTSPVAVDDTAATRRNTATAVAVLANDYDPDGDLAPTTVSLVTLPNKGGKATPNSDGTVSYRPKSGFTGTETFAYTVRDDSGALSNKATVTVTVTK